MPRSVSLKRGLLGISLLGPVLLTSACIMRPDVSMLQAAPGYPAADGPGEVLQPDEAKAATAIGDAIEGGLKRIAATRESAPDGSFDNVRPFIRDAHPKAHGCAKAEFQVARGLPAELAKGIFAEPGKTYCSWVRFSNSNEDTKRSDAETDGRGMAIKLLGIKGESLLADLGHNGTQDFVMISNPNFFISDALDYVTVVRQQNQEGGPSILKLFSAIGFKGALAAAEITSLRNRNPFEGEYFSMVPYQLGLGPDAKAIKFKAQPCGYGDLTEEDKTFYRDPEIPEDADPNFLRGAMASSLQLGSPCMEFLIQQRGPGMSVEDAVTPWSAEKAPFVKVARLRFPAGQDFDTREQNLACEDMSYTPWHALPEHKPLGAVNRIRKVVYERISTFRHQGNKAANPEPPTFDLDQCQNGRWQ